MNPIGYESKNAVGKQKISSKYHQLVEKYNSLHVSIGTKKITPWKIALRKINPHPNPNPNPNPNPEKNLLGGGGGQSSRGAILRWAIFRSPFQLDVSYNLLSSIKWIV